MRLVIATSVHGGDPWAAQVCVGYLESRRRVAQREAADVIDVAITFAAEQCRARNRLAAIFLRDFPSATHLLWWDSDQWPHDPGVVREMGELNLDVVGAPYTTKVPPLRWVHRALPTAQVEADGLLEVAAVGLGFTLVSRTCLEHLSASCRQYTDYTSHGAMRVADLFGLLFRTPDGMEPGPDDELLSEDYSFCDRWSRAGGRVWLYTHAGLVAHVGARAWTARDMAGGVAHDRHRISTGLAKEQD